MWDYSPDTIVENLMVSFKNDPMSLDKMCDNYFVSSNGLHRFHVLKVYLLSEMANATTEEEKEQIRQKYVIPVKCSEIDYIKTYCNFLLSMIKMDYSLEIEVDSNHCYTGNVILEISGEKEVLTDDQLMLLIYIKCKELDINCLSFSEDFDDVLKKGKDCFDKRINELLGMEGKIR